MIASTFLALEPLTGPHASSWRVHCAAMGWPIVGDTVLRPPRPRTSGPGLHLARARRSWCRSTRTVHRSASVPPVPLHMHERLRALRLERRGVHP